jgi:hypothetical protein
MGDSPEVIVERLQLREVAVKRGHVSRPYTPERSDLEYFACERHGHDWGGQRRQRAVLTGNHKLSGVILSLGKDEPRLY